MTTEDYNEKSENEHEQADDRPIADAASRARNQTVMLTPEVTGQVRALLNKNVGQKRGADPLSELLPPASSSSSWEAVPEAAAPMQPEPAGHLVQDNNATTVFSTDALSSVQTPLEREPSGFGAPVEPASQGFVQPQGRPPGAPSFSVGQQQPAPAPVQPVQARKSKIVGFLVSFDNDDNGELFEIGAGRWLVTSRATEHGDFILINDETISPLHAIVRATKSGTIQILDQLSEYGTAVTAPGEEEEEEITGTMINVEHGALVRFGKRHFVVCVVPQVDVWKGDK